MTDKPQQQPTGVVFVGAMHPAAAIPFPRPIPITLALIERRKAEEAAKKGGAK